MKWGVRRYQNEDGSLTSAGKKRYDEDGDSDDKYSVERREPSSKSTFARKSDPRGMTDEELDEAINRLNKEQKLKELQRNLNPYTTDQKTTNQIGKQVVTNTAKVVGSAVAAELGVRVTKTIFDNYDKLSEAAVGAIRNARHR